MEQKADIQLSLSAEHASVLALFLKRQDSSSVRSKSASDGEADDISVALTALMAELAYQGFDPR